MNKPSKCKNCQWYGKPYWGIINPCDNCPRENTNVEIITRWQDPTIEEYQKEIERLNNILDEIEKYIKENSWYYNTSDGCQWIDQFKLLDKLKELKEK